MAVSRGFAKASGTVSRPPPPSPPARLRTPALHCKRAAQNKNGYCSRLCLSGMQIHVLKYLRKTRAKRAQKRRPIICEKASFHTSFRRFPKYPFRNDRRDSSRRQYRAIRRQPPPSGKQKPPITTRCLYRTRCQIPALSQSVRARNTRNPLRIKAMPQPACNLR